eukprot:GEMP01015699.1.p1 GENE.GEMP01015699.1~~GEMP01015699.1.p1  ORF type:complete len:279 (+),score=74.25 GEMP01015699.1:1243-2079(+)
MREEVIKQAQKFLSNPIVLAKPVGEKEQFLDKKGLSKEEIAEAMRRAASPTSVPSHDTSASSNHSSLPSNSAILTHPHTAYALATPSHGTLAVTFLRKRLADLDYERAVICHALMEAERGVTPHTQPASSTGSSAPAHQPTSTSQALPAVQPLIVESTQHAPPAAPPASTGTVFGIIKSGDSGIRKPWERVTDDGAVRAGNLDRTGVSAKPWERSTKEEVGKPWDAKDKGAKPWDAKDEGVKPWERSLAGRLTIPWSAEEFGTNEDEPEKTPEKQSKM